MSAAISGLALCVALATPDITMLARAIEGEGASLFGDRRDTVGLWVGHVAMNRYETGWWSDLTFSEMVERDFHGVRLVTEPASWAVDLATKAYRRDHDVADGALFVLSKPDTGNLHADITRSVEHFKEGEWELYFFREWPG